MNPILATLGRRLRLLVVGGGPGSFIGPVHRLAARYDDRFEVTAAVLSSDPALSKAHAVALGIDPERAYGDWVAALAGESARADGADAIAIMTPNDSHFPIAMAAVEKGLPVICDKPMTVDLDEARRLVAAVERSQSIFCVTYNYTAYPMVRQARDMVRDGVIGEVRQIELAYVQGHNARLVEADTSARGWRFEGKRAGRSLILGDIGTHAFHLGAFVSGLDLEQVMADLWAAVPGREVDDAAHLLMRWSGGARGTMWVTNSAAGAEHGLAFRLFGSKGGLEWRQEQPNDLLHRRLDAMPVVLSRRLHGALSASASRASRLEIGHPEGYQAAFANLYKDVAEVIAARIAGHEPDPLALDFPGVRDGAKGLAMIDAALSSAASGQWTRVACDF